MELLEDILFIDYNFKIVSKSIIPLESSKLQLSEALNIVDKVSHTVIQNNNSLISEKVKCALESCVRKSGEERMMLKLIRKRKRNLLGLWLRRNCLLKDALEEMTRFENEFGADNRLLNQSVKQRQIVFKN
ncbi:hypothetical protein ANN_25323 [Periplaneta americana]|uniref:Uncharacterized protein n=1 Tax=Periplaneta americana TaxID=6978 RepID=A0ABQ8S108_PERAM|nr:hypothetical protein ANN_25323 [Periplaneta americana]